MSSDAGWILYIYIKYILIHRQTFSLNRQIFRVARPARCFKLVSKPGRCFGSRTSYPRYIDILSKRKGILNVYQSTYTLLATWYVQYLDERKCVCVCEREEREWKRKDRFMNRQRQIYRNGQDWEKLISRYLLVLNSRPCFCLDWLSTEAIEHSFISYSNLSLSIYLSICV